MKINIITAIVLFLFSLKVVAQINLNDPKLIIKNQYGNVISADSATVIINKGPIRISKKLLNNGKTEITVIPIDDKEINKMEDSKTKWIKKWKGLPLPDFELKTLDKQLLNKSSIKGKVTVFNFWFIKCGPCVREIPELNKLVEKYSHQPVRFFAPSSIDSQNDLLEFLKKKTFDYTIVTDEKELIKKMEISSFPVHIIVDEKGVIRELVLGAINNIYEELDGLIKRVLEKE